MSTLRLLVVDDEPLIRTGIRNELSGMASVQVAGECGCVTEAVEAIHSQHFDLVLLDVQMPDGTGFDVIRQVGPQRMPAVVFVTAYDKYAIQAFDVNAVDYLLKPFDDLRLRESIDRARDRLSRPAEVMRQMEALLEAREAQWLRKLVVRNGDRYDLVTVDSIDWIESANNYAVLHCQAKDHLFGENMSALERMLDLAASFAYTGATSSTCPESWRSTLSPAASSSLNCRGERE
jgi:two-component system LytT family response regulator